MIKKALPYFNPSIEEIKARKVPPTEGEKAMLNFLYRILDDSYEIYFEPYLNGDRPDIVVMRKGSGVLIIEVKDWDLDLYELDDTKNWKVKNRTTNYTIKSPISQVLKYKENLYRLHIDKLLELNIRNKNYFGIVSCAVYFHNATKSKINALLVDDYKQDKNYQNFLDYIDLLGNDCLAKDRFNSILSKRSIGRKTKAKLFSDDLYNRFKRFLQPPMHEIEDGKDITYTKEQKDLIKSEIRPRRKVKGVAGSGKTLVLAKRAVNAHIRTDSRILILTFNLTLCNYIHDRISDVRENFVWDNFYITNYHNFIKQEANNHNIVMTFEEGNDINEKRMDDMYYDVNLFEMHREVIIKYDAIFIDEIQDYEQEWLDIITKYFMHDDSEFVVFGDEKQNVYGRDMDDSKEPIVRGVPGAWNKSLKKSHRFTNDLGRLAEAFQMEIFKDKYTNDKIETLQALDFEKRIIEYHFFEKPSSKFIADTIFDIAKRNEIHNSDITILGSKVEYLRPIDYNIRKEYNQRTTINFEASEELRDLLEPDKKIEEVFHIIKSIRRTRKANFWMKSGTIKLSTIHSFKGWEGNTIFALVGRDNNSQDTEAELIYTAITRARKNLIILSMGNPTYDRFFQDHIQSCFKH